jgi:hypothetical protein
VSDDPKPVKFTKRDWEYAEILAEARAAFAEEKRRIVEMTPPGLRSEPLEDARRRVRWRFGLHARTILD